MFFCGIRKCVTLFTREVKARKNITSDHINHNDQANDERKLKQGSGAYILTFFYSSVSLFCLPFPACKFQFGEGDKEDNHTHEINQIPCIYHAAADWAVVRRNTKIFDK